MQGIHVHYVLNSKHVTHTHTSDSLVKMNAVPLLYFRPDTYYSRTRLRHERTEYFVLLQTSVVLAESFHVIVQSEQLIGTVPRTV